MKYLKICEFTTKKLEFMTNDSNEMVITGESTCNDNGWK